MAKTNPIGVRFDEELLNELKKSGYADSPQKALNLLESYYRFSKIFNSRPKGRDNKFENAARCRDESAVNNDEKKSVDNLEVEQRIKVLNYELANIPSNPAIGKWAYRRVREKEILELENKLK